MLHYSIHGLGSRLHGRVHGRRFHVWWAVHGGRLRRHSQVVAVVPLLVLSDELLIVVIKVLQVIARQICVIIDDR